MGERRKVREREREISYEKNIETKEREWIQKK